MSDPAKILVVQPSWVGDAVMATPTLRSLRLRYPNAEISYLMKRYVKPLYAGMPWADRLITYRTGKTKAKAGKGQFFDLAARLRSADFDMAVLLPNSFKSALVCRMAKIKKVVGYDRDGRGFLLSDRLLAPKEAGKFVPNPIIKYYLGLAHYLGAGRGGASGDLKMELFVTPAEKREAEAVLERGGLPRDIDRPGSHGQPPMILLNPGANYGAAKLWKAEYFAELADRFIEELGATVLISAAPKERPIVEQIKRHMKRAPVDLSNKGTDLGNLKEIIRRCDLMVTNDTGPRHIAAAMDVPVVTIFGPTHPEWTEIYYPKERQVAVKVFCGPCQKKTCPLDHRCITRVTPAMVWDKSVELLKAGSASEPQTTVVAALARDQSMDDRRKNAYRTLLYRAMLDMRSLRWMPLGLLLRINPVAWRRDLIRIRRAGEIAEWLHNLAAFAARDFQSFDEDRFWQQFDDIEREHPEFLTTSYRAVFDKAVLGEGGLPYL